MFTGIIEEIGKISSIKRGAGESRLVISGNIIFDDLKIGDSVAVNGVCLTAAEISGRTFAADVMNETFNRSSLSDLKPGSRVNLERALAAGGIFGGHIVAGHVDGTGTVTEIKNDGIAVWYKIAAESFVLRYIVEKGSVSIDGISLTVAAVTDKDFSVSVIPHTARETILSNKKCGDRVNIENDMIGKYVEKLTGCPDIKNKRITDSNITADFLIKNGF